MAGQMDGKVAFITGAARGMGRSHALRFAREGADIIAVDLCRQIDSVPYELSTADDLADTAAQIESAGRRVVTRVADVRDYRATRQAADDGVAELGHLDVVVANAGIFSFGRLETLDERTWQDMIDVNLTGAWNTAKAAIPHLRDRGGGCIVFVSSTAALRGTENIGHYAAAKRGVASLMQTLAVELAADSIRVNAVYPTTVDTDMIHNEATYSLFAPDLDAAARTRDRLAERFRAQHALGVPWVEPADISNAVLWLASAQARYVTGASLPIDAGRRS
jgi:(+)-trans-carveol dehydrogenase